MSLEHGEMFGQNRQRLFKQQDQSCVGKVLTGSSPVNEAGCSRIFPAHELGERLNERDGRGSGAEYVVSERGNIKRANLGSRDRPCSASWNDPDMSLRVGQRNFKLQHGTQDRLIGEQVGQGFGGGKGFDQARGHPSGIITGRAVNRRIRFDGSHTSKNTVSFSPPRRMSNCQPLARDLSVYANKVSLRLSGTSASTGSCSFAGSPAK